MEDLDEKSVIEKASRSRTQHAAPHVRAYFKTEEMLSTVRCVLYALDWWLLQPEWWRLTSPLPVCRPYLYLGAEDVEADAE